MADFKDLWQNLRATGAGVVRRLHHVQSGSGESGCISAPRPALRGLGGAPLHLGELVCNLPGNSQAEKETGELLPGNGPEVPSLDGSGRKFSWLWYSRIEFCLGATPFVLVLVVAVLSWADLSLWSFFHWLQKEPLTHPSHNGGCCTAQGIPLQIFILLFIAALCTFWWIEHFLFFKVICIEIESLRHHQGHHHRL